MQRSRSVNNNENRFTSIPAEGGQESWGDLLLRQPVKDDGRRQRSTTSVPSGGELTGPTGYPNRWIVGPGVGGAWATLIGQLVEWSGSAWVADPDQRVGQLAYSYKRDEYLELVDTIQNSIAPTLTPPIMVSSSGSVLRFWMPQSLLDSYQTSYKGTIKSLTTQSASWTTLCYDRYGIRSDDATYSAYADYIATYVADILSNSGKWVFQPAKEGDFIWVEDANSFYYHNGTTWVVFSGGTGVAALYAAEGRAGSGAAPTMTLTASVVNTFQKVAFPYSAVLDLVVCPPSFFADGLDEFEAPRTGHYSVGFNAFYTVREPGVVDQLLTFVVRVNGTTIPSGTFVLPNVDNYEGEGFKCILKLTAGDLVTFEFKCTGADWASDITVHNGPNFFIHTIDAVGNESGLVPHALNEHTDTNFPTPADGDTIVWDAGASEWVNSAAPPPGAHTLGSHSDTTFSSLATNDVVKWNGSIWVNGPVSAGPHTIIGSSHSDTVLTGSLANNHVLTYDSTLTKWTNKVVPTPSLDNLSNVSVGSKAVGDFLWWTGVAWANRAIRLDDLFDVAVPSPSTGQSLVWNGSAWVPGSPAATVTARCGSFQFQPSTSIPSGAVPWTADYQTGSFLPSYPNNGAFVADLLGKWKVTYTGSVSIPSGGTLRIRVNGGSYVGAVITNSTGSTISREFTLSYNQALSSGSYVELVPSSGVTINDAQATFEYLGA